MHGEDVRSNKKKKKKNMVRKQNGKEANEKFSLRTIYHLKKYKYNVLIV